MNKEEDQNDNAEVNLDLDYKSSSESEQNKDETEEIKLNKKDRPKGIFRLSENEIQQKFLQYAQREPDQDEEDDED